MRIPVCQGAGEYGSRIGPARWRVGARPIAVARRRVKVRGRHSDGWPRGVVEGARSLRVPRPLRRISDPVLERIPVPILGGVNRGRWWCLASAGHGYATGRRAHSQMQVLAALIRPGDTVWDVGAHHGYVTLCASDRVGPRGSVQAFEPSARNRRLLLRHLRWNRIRNVAVHPYALSSFDGWASFGGGYTSKMCALGRGSEMVSVRTVTTLLRSEALAAPTFVKLDVEGAEAEVLQGAMDVLPPVARLVIAIHSRETDCGCTALLKEAGYELIASDGLMRCRTGVWIGDPDLFAMGPEYAGRDRDRSLAKRYGLPRGRDAT